MAEGFLRSLGSDVEVHSAGTEPASRVHPFAVRVMKEAGIDISGGVPKSVGAFLGQPFEHVITVCDDADRNCPRFSGTLGKRSHIAFIDPARAQGTEDEVLAVFRQVREEIRTRMSEYYEKEIKNQ